MNKQDHRSVDIPQGEVPCGGLGEMYSEETPHANPQRSLSCGKNKGRPSLERLFVKKQQ